MMIHHDPKVKFTNKLVDISKILGEEKTIQARQSGTDASRVDQLELSIEAIGLSEPIGVEELESDPAFPNDDTFTLREGNHRLTAFKRLFNKHGVHYQYISCQVYEKNTSPESEYEWMVWQVAQNEHNDKVCTPNSDADLANMLSQLLISGQIGCKLATKAVQMNKWESLNIEKAIDAYISKSSSFKGMRASRKQAIKEKVWDFHGQIYKQKIKRYDPKTDIKAIIQNNFNTLKPNTKSQDGKFFVRCATNDDLHAAINQLIADAVRGKNVLAENVLVFHCKVKDTNLIDSLRVRCKKLVKEANDLVSKNVKGFKNKKVIPRLYFPGQKIEQGEVVDKLAKQRL